MLLVEEVFDQDNYVSPLQSKYFRTYEGSNKNTERAVCRHSPPAPPPHSTGNRDIGLRTALLLPPRTDSTVLFGVICSAQCLIILPLISTVTGLEAAGSRKGF